MVLFLTHVRFGRVVPVLIFYKAILVFTADQKYKMATMQYMLH
jgi:hypothetical protein